VDGAPTPPADLHKPETEFFLKNSVSQNKVKR
jgi:hypothetical protein